MFLLAGYISPIANHAPEAKTDKRDTRTGSDIPMITELGSCANQTLFCLNIQCCNYINYFRLD